MQDIVDNRHSLVNQRQPQSSPIRNPTQTFPPKFIPSTLPSSQLFNYNYDPVTDFAWNTFKVSSNLSDLNTKWLSKLFSL